MAIGTKIISMQLHVCSNEVNDMLQDLSFTEQKLQLAALYVLEIIMILGYEILSKLTAEPIPNVLNYTINATARV